MGLSRRAKRGIAIFNKIQTGPNRLKYLLSMTKIKELLNGQPTDNTRITVGTEPAIPVIRTGRETANGPNATGANDAEPTGEIQPVLHDVYADEPGRAPGTAESAENHATEIGPDVSERNDGGGH